jgi:hypothetical protein
VTGRPFPGFEYEAGVSGDLSLKNALAAKQTKDAIPANADAGFPIRNVFRH